MKLRLSIFLVEYEEEEDDKTGDDDIQYEGTLKYEKF